MEPIRINKYLSDCGVCSRREADRLIAEGRVTVDGLRAETGMKVTLASKILVDGKKIGRRPDPVLIAVHKPAGVVTTSAEDEPNNIVTYVGWPERIYPIGRLDKDSEGLILMTNQGELAEKIAHARGRHEKEYLVTVDRGIDRAFVEKMASGVRILNTTTRPCTVEKVSKFRFRIVLTQGLNRQIRRMCEALGYHVTELVRTRVMNISLNGLEIGHWRRIEGEEYDELLRQLGMK